MAWWWSGSHTLQGYTNVGANNLTIRQDQLGFMEVTICMYL